MLVITVTCSLTGFSGERIGDNSSSFPWPGGVHRAWSQPIGMNTKPSLGTGFAGVWAHAVAAGTIASSSGSANAACALFRNVRLGIAFFVRNIALSFYLEITRLSAALPATAVHSACRI